MVHDMATYLIPIDSNFDKFSFTIDLEGLSYIINITWSYREEAWYYDLLTIDEEAILQGKKLVVDFPLFLGYTDERLPEGDIVVYDQTGKGDRIGRNDLGARGVFIFKDNQEISSLV